MDANRPMDDAVADALPRMLHRWRDEESSLRAQLALTTIEHNRALAEATCYRLQDDPRSEAALQRCARLGQILDDLANEMTHVRVSLRSVRDEIGVRQSRTGPPAQAS